MSLLYVKFWANMKPLQVDDFVIQIGDVIIKFVDIVIKLMII